MIEISEIRIRKQVSLLNNLNRDCYLFELTLIETSAGGALLYKCRNDPDIYEKNELEFTFIEIVNLKS